LTLIQNRFLLPKGFLATFQAHKKVLEYHHNREYKYCALRKSVALVANKVGTQKSDAEGDRISSTRIGRARSSG
jgi:hypothetical protein